MRFILFFLLSFVGVCGEGKTQHLSKDVRDAIANYPRMEVHRFAGISPTTEDAARYKKQIHVEISYSNGEIIRIAPYVWNKDTAAIFIDSVTLKESPIKAFLDTLIKPVYDSLNHRPVYTNRDMVAVLQIDTVNNETVIVAYKLRWLTPSHFKESRKFNASYTTINSVPLLVYGNAVNLYFNQSGHIRMSNPYPKRAAVVFVEAYSFPKQYRYRNGTIEHLQYDEDANKNDYPYLYASYEEL